MIGHIVGDWEDILNLNEVPYPLPTPDPNARRNGNPSLDMLEEDATDYVEETPSARFGTYDNPDAFILRQSFYSED